MLLKELRYCIFLTLLCINPLFGFSQIKVDSLTNHLQNTHYYGDLTGKYFSTKILTLPQELNCSEANHHYLWYKNKLVVQVDGSGKLYEVLPGQPMKRIDKSCYEGYCFGSFSFVYQDTIFSLGGYGFWQFNGMLRYYDDKNGEWFVVATNKTIPINRFVEASSKVYYDLADKKIYVLYITPNLLYLDRSNNIIDKTIYTQCFDLVSKKWWDEPKSFNSNLKSNLEGFGIFPTKNGLLILTDTLALYDFKNNQLKRILSPKREMIHNSTTQKNFLFFSQDSIINFYSPETGKIDSIKFGSNDLESTNIPLYLPIKHNIIEFDEKTIIIISLALLLILITVYFSIKNKKLKNHNAFITSHPMYNVKRKCTNC